MTPRQLLSAFLIPIIALPFETGPIALPFETGPIALSFETGPIGCGNIVQQNKFQTFFNMTIRIYGDYVNSFPGHQI